jgi:hypothetical protein
MNVVSFNERTCEKYRRYFDAYLDNELPVEIRQEVLQHIHSCSDCNGILNSRSRMKQLLRSAVTKEKVPVELAEAVRNRFRTEHRSFFGPNAAGWMMAAAALLALAIGGVAALQWGSAIQFRGDDGAFQNISARLQGILRIGLIDHVHCAILLERWKRLVSFDEMRGNTGRSALGPDFIDLVPAVQSKLGADYKIVEGHRCVANHRQYIHLIATGDKDTVLSLVITEKTDESFTPTDAVEIMSGANASPIPIYRGRQGKYEVAGFESGKHLAFVISNLDRDSNLDFASVMAPVVYNHLHRLEL